MLKTIKEGATADKTINVRIDYAIEKIGQKAIYDVDIVNSLDLATTKRLEGKGVAQGWIREFSSIHMDEVRGEFLENLHQKQHETHKTDTETELSKALSLNTVIGKMKEH